MANKKRIVLFNGVPKLMPVGKGHSNPMARGMHLLYRKRRELDKPTVNRRLSEDSLGRKGKHKEKPSDE